MYTRQATQMMSYARRRAISAGFTLVELIVAVSIFSVVMLVSMGTLVTLISATGAAQDTQLISSNLGFILDGLSRDVRTGYRYHCSDTPTEPTEPQDCPEGASSLSFIDAESETGDWIAYRFNTSSNDVEVQTEAGGVWRGLTSEKVYIEHAQFIVTDTDIAGDGDSEQPFVRIILHGRYSEESDQVAPFFLQATLTSRSLDI